MPGEYDVIPGIDEFCPAPLRSLVADALEAKANTSLSEEQLSAVVNLFSCLEVLRQDEAFQKWEPAKQAKFAALSKRIDRAMSAHSDRVAQVASALTGQQQLAVMTSDARVLYLPTELAAKSRVLQLFMDEHGTSEPVVLKDIDASTITLIQRFLCRKRGEPAEALTPEHFLKTLYAANYLDIPALINPCMRVLTELKTLRSEDSLAGHAWRDLFRAVKHDWDLERIAKITQDGQYVFEPFISAELMRRCRRDLSPGSIVGRKEWQQYLFKLGVMEGDISEPPLPHSELLKRLINCGGAEKGYYLHWIPAEIQHSPAQGQAQELPFNLNTLEQLATQSKWKIDVEARVRRMVGADKPEQGSWLLIRNREYSRKSPSDLRRWRNPFRERYPSKIVESVASPIQAITIQHQQYVLHNREWTGVDGQTGCGIICGPEFDPGWLEDFVEFWTGGALIPTVSIAAGFADNDGNFSVRTVLTGKHSPRPDAWGEKVATPIVQAYSEPTDPWPW